MHDIGSTKMTRGELTMNIGGTYTAKPQMTTIRRQLDPKTSVLESVIASPSQIVGSSITINSSKVKTEGTMLLAKDDIVINTTDGITSASSILTKEE